MNGIPMWYTLKCIHTIARDCTLYCKLKHKLTHECSVYEVLLWKGYVFIKVVVWLSTKSAFRNYATV